MNEIRNTLSYPQNCTPWVDSSWLRLGFGNVSFSDLQI